MGTVVFVTDKSEQDSWTKIVKEVLHDADPGVNIQVVRPNDMQANANAIKHAAFVVADISYKDTDAYMRLAALRGSRPGMFYTGGYDLMDFSLPPGSGMKVMRKEKYQRNELIAAVKAASAAQTP